MCQNDKKRVCTFLHSHDRESKFCNLNFALPGAGFFTLHHENNTNENPQSQKSQVGRCALFPICLIFVVKNFRFARFPVQLAFYHFENASLSCVSYFFTFTNSTAFFASHGSQKHVTTHNPVCFCRENYRNHPSEHVSDFAAFFVSQIHEQHSGFSF